MAVAPEGALARATSAAKHLGGHGELIALFLLVASIQLLPTSVPVGIYGIGLVAGSLLALQAIALVLVYRSNRVINFAQASFAFAGATLFASLVQYRSFLRLLRPVCGTACLDNPTAVNVNYVLALLVALGFVALSGWLTYYLVVRRFSSAPRLVLTVATIFVGFTVTGLAATIADSLIPAEVRERGAPPGLEAASPPFEFSFRLGVVTFHAAEVLTVIVVIAALAALVVYLKRSATGNAIRAAAEDPARASMLGINVHAVSGRVWFMSATLSGVAGVLAAMAGGTVGSVGASETKILAVAVVARFTSVPLAVAAGVVLGVLEQALQWSVGSTVALEAGLFVLVAALLLMRARRETRAERALEGEWRAAREIRPIPEELRDVPTVVTWKRTAIAFGAVIVAGLPWVVSPSQTNLAAAIITYAIIGLSLLVLTGWAGQISLGQVAFAAIGAYVAAVSGLPFLLALVVGAVAGGVAALAVGLPALRLRGLHLAVITLAFHQAVLAVLLNPEYLGDRLPASLQRPSILGVDFGDERAFYYLCLAAIALVTAGVVGMRRSRTARALLAARDNELAAQAFGINLTRARVGAFVVSGAIAALAGVLLAYHQEGVQAAAFNAELSRTIFLYAVIGGLGATAGPIIGFVYYALPLFLTLPGLVPLLLSGPGGLLLLLLTPGGIGQLLFDARDRWLRKIARRNRIVVPSLLADTAHLEDDAPVPLAPKVRAGGGTAYVAERYRLGRQWLIDGTDGTNGNGTGGSNGNGRAPSPTGARDGA